jgi:hypothetical protein
VGTARLAARPSRIAAPAPEQPPGAGANRINGSAPALRPAASTASHASNTPAKAIAPPNAAGHACAI